MSGVAIAALVILILLVAIILIILLTPITYAIEVNGRSPYKGEVKVNWLWRVLSVHLAYLEGKPLFKQVYLLGKQRIGPIRDYEDWLNHRVEQEFNASMAEEEMDAVKSEAKATEPGVGGTDHTNETDERSDTGTEKTVKEPVVEKVTFDKEGKVQDTVYKTDEHGETVMREVPVDEAKTDDTQSGESAKGADDVKASSTEAPKSSIDKFWWAKHVKNVALWEQLMLIGKRSYLHSKPRDMFVEGRFGLGDPFRTGMLASAIYAIWPEKIDDIELEYAKFHAEGSGHIKGRIILGVLAWYGTRFALSQPVRALLSDVIHVLWTKQKERRAARLQEKKLQVQD